MNLRLPLIWSLVLVALMAAVSAYAWEMLPPDAQLATHWGLDGKVNGHMGKTLGLTIVPAIALFVTLLIAVVPSLEPRRDNLIASRKAFLAFWMSALVLLLVIHALIVANALGFAVDVPQAAMAATALMILVGGNFLGKVRPNFFLGVRTPWTLSSDLSWDKSHRLLGRLFVFSGLATLAADLAIGPGAAGLVLAGTLTTSAFAAVASSYVYWRHDPERRTG
jgi:immunity protein, SdpI family